MAEIVVKLVNGELAGKTMQSITKEVNAAALALKKAEVGTQAWVDANKKLEDTKQLQADLKKQIEGTTSASELLKGAWNKLPGAQYFNQIGQSFGMLKSGVGGLVSQFGVLKTAVAATGIGALLLIIVSLVSWFKNVNTGADLMEDALVSVRATVDVLIDRLGKFISGLIRFVKGDFKAGIDEMGASFKGVGDEIMRDVNAAQQLAASMRDLEDAEIDYKIKAAETENQIKALMLQARNRKLSEEERITLLNQALALEKNINKELMNNSEEGLRIANEAAAARLNITKGVSESEIAFGKRILEEFKKDGQVQADDLRDKVVERLITMEDAEGKSIALQEKIQNQRDALLDKQEEEAQKRREKESKDREKAAQDEINTVRNIQDLKVAAIEDGLSKEIAQIGLDTERKIEALIGSEEQISEQKQLLLDIQEQQLQAIRDKYALIQAEKDKKAKDDQDKRDKDAADKKIATEKAIADAEEQTGSVRIDTARNVTAALGDLLSSQIKNEKAARSVRRSFAIAEIAINLIQELAANSAAGAKIAAQAPPYTIPAGIAYTAAANVRSIVRAGVATAKVFLLRKGGYIHGPSHDQGGIPGVVKPTGQMVEFEGGEFLFSKKAVKAIGVHSLSMLNDMYTNKFAFGGPVNPFTNTTQVSKTSQPGETGDPFNLSSLIAAQDLRIQMLIEAQDRRMDRIKVINVVTETEEGIQMVNKIRQEADI